jgi:hypothetical protein
MNFIRIKLFLILAFGCFCAEGCGTVPLREVEALPAPVRNFLLPKNAIVRMPVEIRFSDKGGLLQPLADLFKTGTLDVLPYVDAIPGFKGRLGSLWKEIQKPIFIDRQVWLTVNPVALGVGRMRIDPQKPKTAHTVLEMVARPELFFGRQAPPFIQTAMPPLLSFKPGPVTFMATSNLQMTYAEANNYFKNPQMGIIGMPLKGTGDLKVTIQGLRFYGSGGKVIVEVKLHYHPILLNLADKPGQLTLYLKGTPRYLARERVFDFPDLDFDIKTNDFLVQAADWVLKPVVLDQLRVISRLPIGAETDRLKARMNVVLNRPIEKMGRLDTKVDAFDVIDGFADNTGVEARVNLRGTAVMELNWN